MNKLILAGMVYNEETWLPLMLKSIIQYVDYIVLVDTHSTDKTIEKANEVAKQFNKTITWLNYTKRNDPTDDGAERNVYLKYLIENHCSDYAIVLDADEIVKGRVDMAFEYILKDLPEIECGNIKFQHFIGDFGHVDATIPEHYTMRRFFKIQEGLYYPEVEHNTLQHKERDLKTINIAEGFEVWHVSDAKNIYHWKNKFENNRAKSNIHSPEHLEWWYYSRLFGAYPTRGVEMSELPKVIKDEFFIHYKINPLKTMIIVCTVPGNMTKLLRCIESIERNTHEEHEIFIYNNDYKGFAKSYNKGLELALYNKDIKGVVIINDDIIVRNFNWLNILRDNSHHDDKYYITGAHNSKRESPIGDYTAFYCVYIPKEIYKIIGLLDEQFEVGEMEDVDYCYRAIQAGFGIMETQGDIIWHEVNGTIKNLTPEQEEKRKLNKDKFKRKWNIKN